jgi:peptidoglycan DL-endopeptidase CwlO
MLHAPRTGDVVKVSTIYMRNLAGVVRISPQISARVR